MRRWLPHTLFGQMLLILLAGLLVSHLIGSLIYASDRAQAVRAIGGYAATQRIANLARLLDEAPAAWRSRIAAAASDPSMQVTLSAVPPAFAATSAEDDFSPIRTYLAEQLPSGLAESLRVQVSAASPVAGQGWRGPPAGQMMGGGLMMGRGPPPGRGPPGLSGADPWPRLQAAMRLSDGQWLGFATALPNAAPPAPWPFPVAIATMGIVVVLASAWAVRRTTAPLRMLAVAAEQLGRNLEAPPLAEAGTTEMRQAARSFNQMQARIRRLLDNRTQMLGALSHDLRTPLTLLRLRTENLPEAEERDRMLATLGELDGMIETSLSFVRDQSRAEAWRRTDLTALVASLVDDMADAGLKVSMAPAEPIVLECQPGGLRRVFANLIDNAVKYAGSALVTIAVAGTSVHIDIDDEGPGIPEAELQRVFEPFRRLEQSRSRETGGTGLGLSIALSIVEAHGGEITLANRSGGGLRARVSLPVGSRLGAPSNRA
jgi:signal transduction histidine kinase